MASMNTLGSAGVSDYQSRTVTIEVAGVCQQSVLKTGSYTVRVPFSQMSQAMQTINRQGGKVASVQLMGNPPAVADSFANVNASADMADKTDKVKKRKR
ncbi:MAG: phycobilisome linker polypeptide [Cyanobacteria bacterium P01_C01_bin.121]